MKQEQTALILAFIDECQKTGTLADESTEACEKMWNLICKAGDIVDTHEDAGDLHLQLEVQFLKTVELLKWNFFKYGSLGGTALEENDLKWSPVKKVDNI